MAFGDQGRWHVNVQGVPFRVDGETYDEAQARVADVLSQTPELFNLRAQRLGLDQKDLDAVSIRFEQGDEALKGLVRAEDAVNSPLNKLAIGSGRAILNHYRGARQMIAELTNDEDAAKTIAEEDKNEREIYRQLDDLGVGLEDVGELATDILGFVGVGAAAGTGAIPMFLTGAMLAASDVKGERQVPGGIPGDTELEGGRGTDALIGGTTSLIGPILGKGKAMVSALARKYGLGATAKMSTNLFLRTRYLAQRPEALTNIVDDALTYAAEGAPKAQQVIGRAALDTVQKILSRLPTTAEKGLKDPAAFGLLRNAVKKATQPGSQGANIFNPVIFEKEATALIGQLPHIFTKPEQQLLAAQIGRLSKAMQTLPASVSPQAAERAAAALIAAKPGTEATLRALELATNPSVKQMLLDALVDKGAASIAALRQKLPQEAWAGTAENVSTEGVEDIQEMIQRARRNFSHR